MININELAKETLIALKERGLKPTPKIIAKFSKSFLKKEALKVQVRQK